jgi:hypothetical protein
METQWDWHPTDAEVQAIIEELRPVLAAMSERQHHELGDRQPPRSV